MSDPVIDDFIARAQIVSVTEAAAKLNFRYPPGDKGMPCPDPLCGGKDRFSIHAGKQVWHCRGCEKGGKTGIGLAGHILGHDLRSQAGLLETCAALLGEPIPEGGARETDAERAAREERAAAAKEKADRDADGKAKQQADFREKEVNRARGIYLHATIAPHAEDGPLRRYLRLRTGYDMPDAVFENIRFDPRHTYWHGLDDRGHPLSFYVGFAMVAPFVDLTGRVTGSHETWIDLANGPKYRPVLGLDAAGRPLPTKKMRGTKKGSLIPVCGDMAAARWMGSEGIENVAAVGGAEGFRDDTFYFATGDLGNMAGPADPASAFSHPTLKKADSAGRLRAVRIQGPVPKQGQGPDDAYQVPEHVTTLIHLADGDSERVFTASAMTRAQVRLSRENRMIETWWPPEGEDFAGALSRLRMDVGA